MEEAVEAFEFKGRGGLPSPTAPVTPAEAAEGAEKGLEQAAGRSLAANQELAAAKDAAAKAVSTLASAAAKADEALAARDAAAEVARTATSGRALAEAAVLAANQAVTSCRLRAQAAEKDLTDAAGRKLDAEKLLEETAAAEKAMAAAEKAMAAAEKGKKSKKAEAVEAPVKETPLEEEVEETEVVEEAPADSFDAVKAALTRLKNAVDLKAVTKLLKGFGVAKAAELEEGQYADVIAAADKATAGAK